MSQPAPGGSNKPMGLDTGPILTAILHSVLIALPGTGGFIFVPHRRTAGRGVFLAERGLSEDRRSELAQLGQRFLDRWTGDQISVPSTHPVTVERLPLNRAEVVLGSPLRGQTEVLGTLVVLVGADRPLKADSEDIMSLHASLASICIEQADFAALLEESVERIAIWQTAQARAEPGADLDSRHLQQLLSAMLKVQEDERTRIARDLHDSSNQLIAATLYEIQAAEEATLAGRAENALAKLKTAKGNLRKIEAQNRRIISGLRPPILDARGLAPTLKWYATQYQEQHGLPCSVQISGQPVRLPGAHEVTLYRIVQEALNNVATHARARLVQVRAEYAPGSLHLTIQDDGIGFDKSQPSLSAPDHMGLSGMKERARGLGASLQVISAPGQGTQVDIVVPIDS